MKVLIVDDDPQLTQLIYNRLEQDNYTADISLTGEKALALTQVNSYDLVLLDVGLPKLNGVEVCRTLRRQGDRTLILMLTGKGKTQDKVMALDAGADDYLVKPFELEELMARVRALLRRDSDQGTPLLSYGPLQYDPGSQTVTFADQPVDFRPKERAILELMLRYPQQVFEPDVLLERLWTLAECPSKSTIKSHIRSLRRKFDTVGAHEVIETLYGRGYRLNPNLLEQGAETESAPIFNPASVGQPSQGTTPDLVSQTWGQVQSLSGQRMMELRQLLQGADPQQGEVGITAADGAAAIAIVHQLKGTLGSFGFTAASDQAQQLEAELSAEAQNLPVIQQQLLRLEQLLNQAMAGQETGASEAPQPLLVVSRRQDWAVPLQAVGQQVAVPIVVCSPLDINTYLLAQTPCLVLLELSLENDQIDLSLVSVLRQNYGGQVPVVVVCDAQQPTHQSQALQQGASAIALSHWSATTLFAIASEYLPSSVSRQTVGDGEQ